MTDWSTCPGVESIPGKHSGDWLFTKTRVPVATLFGNLATGATVEELSSITGTMNSRPTWGLVLTFCNESTWFLPGRSGISSVLSSGVTTNPGGAPCGNDHPAGPPTPMRNT